MGRHRRRSRLVTWAGTILVGILPSDGGKPRANAETAEVREDIDSTMPIPVYTGGMAVEDSGVPLLATRSS